MLRQMLIATFYQEKYRELQRANIFSHLLTKEKEMKIPYLCTCARM